MPQRLPIALPQIKASKDLLNEIHQIMYYLYQTKDFTKNA